MGGLKESRRGIQGDGECLDDFLRRKAMFKSNVETVSSVALLLFQAPITPVNCGPGAGKAHWVLPTLTTEPALLHVGVYLVDH